MRLDHGVHALVRAHDGVGWAGLEAQGAANAGAFVDEGHAARRFLATLGGKRQHRLARGRRKPRHAFGTAGRAAVDGRLADGNGLRVGCAIRVAAACALRLRQ